MNNNVNNWKNKNILQIKFYYRPYYLKKKLFRKTSSDLGSSINDVLESKKLLESFRIFSIILFLDSSTLLKVTYEPSLQLYFHNVSKTFPFERIKISIIYYFFKLESSSKRVVFRISLFDNEMDAGRLGFPSFKCLPEPKSLILFEIFQIVF